MTDDESKPMTRTELAMLWDGLNRWKASRPGDAHSGLIKLDNLLFLIDEELTARFGG